MFLSTILSVLSCKAAPHLCKQGLAQWAPILAEVNTALHKGHPGGVPIVSVMPPSTRMQKGYNSALPHFRLTLSTRISVLAFLLQPLPI